MILDDLSRGQAKPLSHGDIIIEWGLKDLCHGLLVDHPAPSTCMLTKIDQVCIASVLQIMSINHWNISSISGLEVGGKEDSWHSFASVENKVHTEFEVRKRPPKGAARHRSRRRSF